MNKYNSACDSLRPEQLNRLMDKIKDSPMAQDDQTGQATDPKELENQIMSANIPKNEREWWAKKRIEELQDLCLARMSNNLRRYLSAYVEELQHHTNILNRKNCNSMRFCIVDRNRYNDNYIVLCDVRDRLKKMLQKDEEEE